MQFEEYIHLSQPLFFEGSEFWGKEMDDPEVMTNLIIVNVALPLDEKQALLETFNITERMRRLTELLQSELEILRIQKDIVSEVDDHVEKAQREYFLKEQLKVISKELGESGQDSVDDELDQLAQRIQSLKASKETQEHLQKELNKVKKCRHFLKKAEF